jgi:hypothetical protein
MKTTTTTENHVLASAHYIEKMQHHHLICIWALGILENTAQHYSDSEFDSRNIGIIGTQIVEELKVISWWW